MKRLLICGVAGLAFMGSAIAQTGAPSKSAYYKPLGYCQLTGMSAATLLSSCSGGIPQKTTIAEICVEAQAIRYRDDGASPTASVGIPVPSGTCFNYAGLMSALSFIQQTSGAIVNVSFYQ